MDVAAADFDDEEAVQAPEGHAVHVEEVDGEDRGGLRVQELAPGCVSAPLGVLGVFQGLENPSDGGRADPMAELEKLALDALVPQVGFSVASRSISAAISALTGGRPVRCG